MKYLVSADGLDWMPYEQDGACWCDVARPRLRVKITVKTTMVGVGEEMSFVHYYVGCRHPFGRE